MFKPKVPCHKCEIREPGCHSSCDRYKEYTVANDNYREHIRAQKTGHLQFKVRRGKWN